MGSASILANFPIIITAIITAVASQLLFKKGMTTMSDAVSISISGLTTLFVGILRNPYILVGMILYGVSFIVWLVVLSRVKLSVVYPLTSLNFVFVIILSYFLLGERLTPIQTAAIVTIIAGTLLLMKS